MNTQDYYLGLDIGTESVGWAVTDSEYRVIKKHGKALWGVRLFDSADTAADRRGFRVARRRIQRRKQRLEWLQEVFAEEIGKVDPGFFYRLRESKFLEEDKRADFPLGRYTLFADKNYNDKDYHRDYPTIYHLRKALIEDTEKSFDVRLVYLAIHHIMKNRGHFLLEGSLETENNFSEALKRLLQAMQEEFACENITVDEEGLREVLLSSGAKSEREKKLKELFSAAQKLSKPQGYVLKLLAGVKTSLKDIFGEEAGLEEFPKLSLDSDFEEVKETLLAALEDRFELVLAVKGLYDWAKLETMRDEETYLSCAKVKSYDKHREDLRRLKSLLKATLTRQQYRDFFHSQNSANNYAAYSGHKTASKRCGYEDFLKGLRSLLKSIENEERQVEITQILQEIDAGSFLVKQTGSDNGVIPHQLHEIELVQILKNASRYLPFLNQKDQSGFDKKEQIRQMFCFRIPYYVGPLDSRSEHAWIVRDNQKIYPWNFAQVVDLEECREKFITRATAKCSYIGEPVLPKNSLLYSKFVLLNIINKLKINGRNISVGQKQGIYQDLCLKGRPVTAKSLANYLGLEPEDELGGFDQEIKASLEPWKRFSWLLTKPDGSKLAEDIILHITLFGDDRRLLKQWLIRKYQAILGPEEIKKVLSYRCSGWGRLSRVFLEEIYHADPETGEMFSLMDMLWNTNNNLMELLSHQYTFGEAVAEYRKEKATGHAKTLQDYLDESYASPAIKRAIHQTMGIVAEVEKILQAPPKRVFVEMAREDQEKGKRTISRHKHLSDLYKAVKKEYPYLFTQLEGETDAHLRRDKLYLYYTQLGKCMYSGESIDLDRLDSDYDIDHIYPQSKVKDDSLNNRVLVKRELNNAKSNTYPLASDIRKNMHSFWNMLAAKKLISPEKLARLKRAEGFSLEESAGFIARQLVETRQSSKIIAELLQRRFADATEIVYVKAGNVSNFRQQQRLQANDPILQERPLLKEGSPDPLFIKCRELNDYHHAKDAYLNVVVGNVYHTKFTRNPLNYLRGKDVKYSLNRMFDFDLERNGVTAWKQGANGSIAVVRQMMGKNNILFTRRASEESGGLFDQQLLPYGNGQIPPKTSDERYHTGRYGKYNGAKGAFFFLVEHGEGKKRKRSIEAVLLMHREEYLSNPLGYCQKRLGLGEPKIIIPKVKINSLVGIGGARMHISGRSGNSIIFKNADQLIVDPYWQMYLKRIYKYLGRKDSKGYPEVTAYDGISCVENQELYQVLLEKIAIPVYSTKYSAALKHLQKGQAVFAKLGCAEQCQVLAEIMKLFSTSAAEAKLELIGAGKSTTGKIRFSKNITDKKPVLIHQSVTGFFEQEIDLLTIE